MQFNRTIRFDSTHFIVCSGGLLRCPEVQGPWVGNGDGSRNFDLQPNLKQGSVRLSYRQYAEESPASLLYTAPGAELAPFTKFSIVVMRQRGGGLPPSTCINVLVNGIQLYSVRISCFAVSVMAAVHLLPDAWEDGTSITSHGKLTWNQNAVHAAGHAPDYSSGGPAAVGRRSRNAVVASTTFHVVSTYASSSRSSDSSRARPRGPASGSQLQPAVFSFTLALTVTDCAQTIVLCDLSNNLDTTTRSCF